MVSSTHVVHLKFLIHLSSLRCVLSLPFTDKYEKEHPNVRIRKRGIYVDKLIPPMH